MNILVKTKNYVFLFIVLMLLGVSGTTYAQYIYVKEDAAGGNNGSSWNDAYTNLHDALNSSFSGDTILVAEGKYKPADNGDRNASFMLKSGVVLLGGYIGDEEFGGVNPWFKILGRDWQNNKTVLSGDQLVNDDTGDSPDSGNDNSFHVIYSEEVLDSLTELNGFYIEAGNANSPTEENEMNGAGLYLTSGALQIKNCIFRNNNASGKGGAVYTEGLLYVKFTTFRDNYAPGGGGAVFFKGSDNLSEPLSSYIINSAFYNNQAFDEGGAVHASLASDIYAANSVFTGNTTLNDGSWGGGFYADDRSYPTIVNCTFYNNSSIGAGAGVTLYAGKIFNSIIRGNTAVSNPQIYILGNPANPSAEREFSYLSVEGGFEGTAIYDINPGFVQPDNPAGEDDLFGTQDDGLMLSEGSMVIDSGRAIMNAEQSDINGFPRHVYNDVDYGAYERQRLNPDLEMFRKELETGGYIFLFHHMKTNHAQIDSPDYDLDEVNIHNCSMQRNLTDEGHKQGVYIGNALRYLRINFDVVLCSPLCRTKESARNIVGLDSTGHDIFRSSVGWKYDEEGHEITKQNRLGTIIGPGHNTMVVTHPECISEVTEFTNQEVQEGDAVIFRPLGGRTYEAVAHITTDTWEKMFRYVVNPTSIKDEVKSIPAGFTLYDNYPNPFNPVTNIEFSLPSPQHVTLRIYNTLGEQVAQLIDEFKPAGNHKIHFNASEMASGIYFYSISAGNFHQTKKLVLLK